MSELFPEEKPQACAHGRYATEFCPACHARGSDPATSYEAARSVVLSSRSLQHRCLFALVEMGGRGTQSEVAAALDLERGQVHKRLSDLKNKGLIRASGDVRPGKTGRNETVWVINEGATHEHG